MILSAADTSHFRPLLNLIACAKRHEPKQRTVVYDLGLTKSERDRVPAEVRRFPFDDFPPHVRNLLIYAWKPLTIRDALRDDEPLIWHDAGNLFWQPLTPIFDRVNEAGFFMPDSGRTIGSHCHPATLRALGAGHLSGYPLRHASLIGASPRGAKIVDRAARYALEESVIAPAGHRRSIHLYDQPIYSILAEFAGISAGEWYSVTRGNDRATPEQAESCLDSERRW